MKFLKHLWFKKKDEINHKKIKKNDLKTLKISSIENLKSILNNLKENKYEKKSIYFNNIVLNFPKLRNKVNIKDNEIKKKNRKRWKNNIRYSKFGKHFSFR